jgi:hypothetical protein
MGGMMQQFTGVSPAVHFKALIFKQKMRKQQ